MRRLVINENIIIASCKSNPAKRNMRLIRHFLTSWIGLLSDSPLNANGLKPLTVYTKFLKNLTIHGLDLTIRAYSALCDLFLRNEAVVGPLSLTENWLDGFRDTPIYKEYIEYTKSRDPLLGRFIVSFLLFGKKLKFDDPNLASVAFRDWELVEDKLSRLCFNEAGLLALRNIVHALVDGIDLLSSMPKFGPGKVSEPGIKGPVKKACGLEIDPQLGSILRSFRNELYNSFPLEFYREVEVREHADARLKFVYKDKSKYRSICMEPNSVMFVQQALFCSFSRNFDIDLMSRFVDLRDQTLSQRACRYGSVTNDVDTIDLSSASDSVSWDLVSSIFPDWIVEWLDFTRSEYVTCPDGSVRRLNKFAPMGSALCFPIQCIVFTALCIYSYMLRDTWIHTHELESEEFSPALNRSIIFFIEYKICPSEGFIHPASHRYQPITVYGDDLIVDSSATAILIDLLSQFGFSVNTSKSFTGAQSFRESCGKFYLNGYDVTPIRYTLEGRCSLKDASFFLSCIALVNRAGDYGYFGLKRIVQSSILYLGDSKRAILFTSDRDVGFGIYSYNPVNDHLRSSGSFCGGYQLSLDYQKIFFKALMPKLRIESVPTSFEYEEYRYMRWFDQRRNEATIPTVMQGSSNRLAAGSRLALGWTPG